MAGLEFKAYAFELKDFDRKVDARGNERVRFTGYASVFGNEDSYGDVIEQGAFRKTLSENAHRVKVLWQHDPYTPIGKPDVAKEDAVGLYTESTLGRSTAALDAGLLLEDGIVDELSIGFTPVKFAMREGQRQGGRSLQEVRLWEFSPVTWAANDLATITGVKDAQAMLRKSHAFAASLREGKGDGIPNNMLDVLDQLRCLTVDLEALLPSGADPSGHSSKSGLEPPTDEPVDPTILTLAAEIRGLVTPTHIGG